MCYQIVERYASCKCLYFTHAVDCCPSHGLAGHEVQQREILVGYRCENHLPPVTNQQVPTGLGYHSSPNYGLNGEDKRQRW
jgi:hypothetical protein